MKKRSPLFRVVLARLVHLLVLCSMVLTLVIPFPAKASGVRDEKALLPKITTITRLYLPLVVGKFNPSEPPPVPDTFVDLKVQIEAAASPVTPGAFIYYSVQYQNKGNTTAAGVKLTTALPQYTQFDSAGSSPGWEAVGAGGQYQLALGSLAAGASGSKTFAVQVELGLPAAVTQVQFLASISDDGVHGADSNPTDNSAQATTPLTNFLDLAVTKSDGGAAAAPGGTVAYTLRYENVGVRPASGVGLVETLPAHTTFDPANSTPGWTSAGGSSYRFSAGSLLPGASGEVVFAVKVASALPAGVESLTNQVRIEADASSGVDTNPSNNTAAVTTLVNAAPDLSITKTSTAQNALPGQTLSYTLSYTNQGNQAATGVVITESLPLHTQFLPEASSPGWVQVGNGNEYTLSTGALPAGGSGSAAFVVQVETALPEGVTGITNEARIADDGANGTDPVPGSNHDTLTIPLGDFLDLALEKSDGGAGSAPGEVIAYTLTYRNRGTRSASGVVITETLPAHTLFSAANSTPGWQAGADSAYTYSLDGLTAGESGTVTFAVQVQDTLPLDVMQVFNQARIGCSPESGVDANPADNTAADSTPVANYLDLVIAKNDSGFPALPGSTVEYAIDFSNAGVRTAVGVVITETLPANTTFHAAASTPGWTRLGATDTYLYPAGTLLPGASGQLVFAVVVDEEIPAGLEEITNVAQIGAGAASGADIHPANNSAEERTAIDASPDLGLVKTSPLETVVPGDTLVYTLVYTNDGTQAASGVVITETLPAETIFNLAESTPGWTASGTPGTYTYALGTLLPGSGGSVLFAVDVDESVAAGVESISNQAAIGDDGASGADLDPEDNQAAVTLPLEAAPDLVVTKTTRVSAVEPGAGLSYRIGFSNAGSQAASGVTLTESLPANTTFDAAGSSAGWTAAGPASYTLSIGDLAPGASQVVTFTVRINGEIPTGVMAVTNQVVISDDGLNGADPTPADNTASTETRIDAAPDLALLKTDGGTVPTPGMAVVYTLSYSNTGSRAALGAVITETLPAYTTFNAALSSQGWDQVGETNEFVYLVGDVIVGGSGEIVFAVTVIDPLPDEVSSISNTAYIAGDGQNGDDLDETNNSASLTTRISFAPDLAVTKTGAGLSAPGSSIVYTISYKNKNRQPAYGVVITETLPDLTAFDAGNSTPGWTQLVGTNQYRFDIGELDGNGSGQVVFAVIANPAMPLGTSFVNTVEISDDGRSGPDLFPGDNTSNFSTLVASGPTNVCGSMTVNTTWTAGNSPYVLTCDVTVSTGVTLTVEPGTVVKFNATSRRLIVNGILNILGTHAGPVYLTSYKDDSAGGDTNGDGSNTLPGPGDWSAIQVNDTGQANIQYAVIRYGGYSATFLSNLYLTQNAVVNVLNSTIAYSSNYGVRIYNATGGRVTQLGVENSTIENNVRQGVHVSTVSSGISQVSITGSAIQNNGSNGFETNSVFGLTFANNSIHSNGGYAALLTLAGHAAPDLTGIAASGNSKNGIALVGPFAQNSSLTYLPGLPYLMPGSGWVINTAVTLVVPAGQVVKAESTSGNIRPNGTLIAVGTADAPVIFTSMKDDGRAGDSNQDGALTAPAKGDWQGITVPSGGKAVLDYAAVSFAGNTGSVFDALVNVDKGGDLQLTHSLLEFSQGYGVRINGVAAQEITQNIIQECTLYGVYYNDVSDSIPASPRIQGNQINYTQIPIKITASTDGYTGENNISNNSGLGNTKPYIELEENLVGVIKFDASNSFDWVFESSPSAAVGSSMEISPGAIFKFVGTTNQFNVRGYLRIHGSDESPVVFTSINDHSAGNATGSGVAAAGSWTGIQIFGTGKTTIDFLNIRFANRAAYLNGTQEEIVITNSVLEKSVYGVYSDGFKSMILEGNLFNQNDYGVYTTGGNSLATASSVVIRNNEVKNSRYTAMRLGGYDSSSTRYLEVKEISGNQGSGNGSNLIELFRVMIVGNSVVSANEIAYRFSYVFVSVGNSLTIGEGSLIKLLGTSSVYNPYYPLRIAGELNIKGTSANPVVITSLKDDTYGGDSNGDGSNTTPAMQDWNYIDIYLTGTANIDHTLIRFAWSAVQLNGTGAAATVKNSTIAASYYGIYSNSFKSLVLENNVLDGNGYGVYTTGGNSTDNPSTVLLRDNQIKNSEFTAIHIGGYDSSSIRNLNVRGISGNTGSGNGQNLIELYRVSLRGNSVLASNELAYRFSLTRVDSGQTLTIGAGSLVKLLGKSTIDNFYFPLHISGDLNISGTSENPVVITSLKDDSYGGDTNGDGSITAPAVKDWNHIYIWNTAKVNISHAIIQYADRAVTLSGRGTQASIRNSTIRNTHYGVYSSDFSSLVLEKNLFADNTSGVYITDGNFADNPSSLLIRDNQFNNHQDVPMRLGGYDSHSIRHWNIEGISGNTGSGNGKELIEFRYSTFTGNSRLSANDFPYYLERTSVPANATLTINPGSVIKLLNGGGYPVSYAILNVYGSLRLEGEYGNPVVVTSYYDDGFGGDSNKDGSATLPSKGNWGGIFIQNTGKAFINHALIRYGGSVTSCVILPCTIHGMIEHNGQELILTNSTLAYSALHAVKVLKPNHLISDNYFENLSTTYEAVFNGDKSNLVVRAENNWWGSAQGPDPYGDGFSIHHKMCIDYPTGNEYLCETYVDAVPWLGQDYGSSQGLLDGALPPAPNRNTAEMEPGVPYIESVRSQQNFFYFGDETSDWIEISVDWNGSEEGRGVPGFITVSMDGNTSWTDVVINNTNESGGSFAFNPQILSPGFQEIKFSASPLDISSVDDLYSGYPFVVRASKFIAPAWLLDVKVLNSGIKVTQKPDYTEAKMTVKLPADVLKLSLGKDGIPIVEKIDIPAFEMKLDFTIRSDGHGEFESEISLDVEDVEVTQKLEVGAKAFLKLSGTLELPWYQEGMSMEGELGAGVSGDIAYKESLLVLIPAIGGAVAALGNVPGLSEVVNAIYVEGKVEPELELSTGMEAELLSQAISWNGLRFSGKATLTATVGIDIIEDVLEASVYGGGEIKPEFCLAPQIAWEKTSGAFFVGGEVKALSIFEASGEKRWEFETSNPNVTCQSLRREGVGNGDETGSATPLVTHSQETFTEWQVETPDYSGAPYAVFSGAAPIARSAAFEGKSSVSDTTLVTNLYKSASPALAVNGAGAVVVWVHDDVNLSAAQSKELYSSAWNGLSWSLPVRVTNNTMVDYEPRLAFLDDQQVMAVWQQIKEAEIPGDATLTTEIAQKVELVYAIYNTSSNTWSSPVYLTDDSSLDHRIKLARGSDGSLLLTWVQNSSGVLLGDTSSPDRLRYGHWNGSSWVLGDITSTSMVALLSYDVALHHANQGILVFSQPNQQNSIVFSDTDLFYVEWNGSSWTSPVRMTQNSVLDESPAVFYTPTGDKRLVWLQENEIMMLGNDWTQPAAKSHIGREGYLLRSFKSAMDSQGNLSLVWTGTSGEGADLFYSLFDDRSQSWLVSAQLTASQAIEKQVSSGFDEYGKLWVAYTSDNVAPETIVVDGITINNVMRYQSTDLHIIQYMPAADLSVVDLSLPHRPNPEPGETVLIRAEIKNSGDWAVESPSISFFDGDPGSGGTLIGNYQHAGFLAAGEKAAAEVQWQIPIGILAPRTIFATVDPGGLIDELDETNNQASLTTILPDLTISSVSTYYYDQYKAVPAAVIYNRGKLPAENVLVEFRRGAVDGPVVYSETIPVIEKEGMRVVTKEILVAGWEVGVYKYYITVDANDEILEMDKANNHASFSIAALPDLVIYAGDIQAALDPQSGGPVNVTVRNWGTAPAENFVVSLYEGPEIDLAKAPIQTWTVTSLAVDAVAVLTTTLDFIPNHLFAVVDPNNSVEEIDERNNISFRMLPPVDEAPVTVGSTDPDLADIFSTPTAFLDGSGHAAPSVLPGASSPAESRLTPLSAGPAIPAGCARLKIL